MTSNEANKLSGSKVNCIIDCRLSPSCTLFNENDPRGRPLPAATHPLLIIVLLFQTLCHWRNSAVTRRTNKASAPPPGWTSGGPLAALEKGPKSSGPHRSLSQLSRDRKFKICSHVSFNLVSQPTSVFTH